MRYKTGKIDKLIERDFWLHDGDSCDTTDMDNHMQDIGMYAAKWITFSSGQIRKVNFPFPTVEVAIYGSRQPTVGYCGP